MTTIGDLLTRDLSRKIEEIIQVDQADEHSVHSEITEYVATALENRTVVGSKFTDLFKHQLGDSRVSDLLDLINAKTPTQVILFEVAKEADTRKVTVCFSRLELTLHGSPALCLAADVVVLPLHARH